MTLRGIIQGLTAIGAIGALYWFVDIIGDRREAKVHARYAAAAKATNIDLDRFNTEDERVAAISEALRKKAVEDARKVDGPQCTATAPQAEALNRISGVTP